MKLLEQIIMDVLGKKVVSLHTDISILTGERVIIFTLESDPQIEIEKLKVQNKKSLFLGPFGYNSSK